MMFIGSWSKANRYFCDHIMKLGFKHACNAGISFGKDDMIIPEEKENLNWKIQMN